MDLGRIKREEKLQKIIDWQEDKPKNDSDWAEDVKAESLHVKFDYQLEEMLGSHIEGLSLVEEKLEKYVSWADVIKFKIYRDFSQSLDSIPEGKTIWQAIDDEFNKRKIIYDWKYAKLNQSVERIAKEIELRQKGFLTVEELPKNDSKRQADTPEGMAVRAEGSRTRVPIGTTYYVDSDNGNDGNDGLGTGSGNAWLSLDTFTENARSAGDVCIVRRGRTAEIDLSGNLTFTSDGTLPAPIIIEGDYDNAWSDRVDLSGTATATLTIGSKTVTFSADVSGVLAAGDWIYASGDNNREFLYEVVSVVTTTVTLRLPYKGGQAGSGKTVYNMDSNPLWGVAGSVSFTTTNYWKIQGINFDSLDTTSGMTFDSCNNQEFYDCVIDNSQTNLAARTFYYFDDSQNFTRFHKCYLLKSSSSITSRVFGIGQADGSGVIIFSDCLVEQTRNNSANTVFETTGAGNRFIIYAYDTEFKVANSGASIFSTITSGRLHVYLRNCIKTTATSWATNSSVVGDGFGVFFEDAENVIGASRIDSIADSIILSETTTVRSGGSNKSIKVTPSTNLSILSRSSILKVFEIPIYATTDSKTYTVYFRPSATGDWSADPTANELWIELEAWGHASNNSRKITKSTGTIDMNGSTSWQSLTVTVAPGQEGVAYLRCWYAKTKEAGSNIFFVDPIPVIT